MEDFTNAEVRNKYLLENLPFIHHIVKKIYHKGLEESYDDYFHEACYLYLYYIQNYNENLNVKLNTYLYSCVYLGLKRYIYQNNQYIKYPKKVLIYFYKINAYINNKNISFSDLSIKDIQEICDCDYYQASLALSYFNNKELLYYDNEIDNDKKSSTTFLDLLKGDNVYEETELKMLYFSLIQYIKDNYCTKVKIDLDMFIREIVYCLFNNYDLPKQQTLAKKYGCSQSQVSRIIYKIFCLARNFISKN